MNKNVRLFRLTSSGWCEVTNLRGAVGGSVVGSRGKNTTKYPCSRCGRVFEYRGNLRAHRCLADFEEDGFQ